MLDCYFVFCEFRPADLKLLGPLRRRGFRTAILTVDPLVLDGLPHSQRREADQVDKIILVEGWGDPHEIRSIARREIPGRIVAWFTGLDEPSQTVAQLRKEEGLPTTDPEVIGLYLDKARLKTHYAQSGRSRLRVLRGQDLIQLAQGLAPWPFPGRSGYLQRSRGAGGYGTRRVADVAALKEAIADLTVAVGDTPSLTRFMQGSTEFVLTEAAAGTLFSFEAVVVGGRVYPIGFTRPLILEANLSDREPRPMPGCIHPVDPPGKAHIVAELSNWLRCDGFRDAWVHIELFIDPSGAFEVIDPNTFRAIGAHCQWAIDEAYGISLGEFLVDWGLGEFQPESLPVHHERVACLQYYLGPAGGGVLHTLKHPDSPAVRWTVQFKPPGTILPSFPIDGGWLGGYLCTAAQEDQVIEVSRSLRPHILLNDQPTLLY